MHSVFSTDGSFYRRAFDGVGGVCCSGANRGVLFRRTWSTIGIIIVFLIIHLWRMSGAGDRLRQWPFW
jgi:hypothetical protein